MSGQLRLKKVPTLLDGMDYLESIKEENRVAWYKVEGLADGDHADIEEEPSRRGEHRWRVRTSMSHVDAAIGLRVFPSPEAALEALIGAIYGNGFKTGHE
jgi:hypothetical protein